MHRQLVPLLFCFTLACADDPEGRGEPLAHQLDDAREHTEGVRAQIDGHMAAADAASDLMVLQALEPPHATAVSEHMDALGHVIGDMGMCESAPGDDVDSMMQMHDMCDDEMDRHAQAIAGAADLTAALEEEERHHTMMMERLDDLDGMGEAMMGSHGMMMCMGHHGMDDHDAP